MRNIPNIYPCFNETYSSSFVVFWNYLGFHHLATVRISSSSGKILLLFGQLNLLLGCPFAKLLRNFCRTKRKIFLSLRISFARKKNKNLRNHSQKSFRAKLPYSAFAKLKFCAIPQFCKNQTVGDGVCFL